MPNFATLPGYALARRLMHDATQDVEDFYGEILNGCDPNDPAREAQHQRPDPDCCLDALMVLRLLGSQAAAGSPSMLPQPGSVTLILTPDVNDVKRLRGLIEHLNGAVWTADRPKQKSHDAHDGLKIITQPRAGGSAQDTRRFNQTIRDAALQGNAVMVIAAAAHAVDPDIQTVVSTQLILIPTTPVMIGAILKLRFATSRIPVPKIDLGGIGELQLARVFAADTPRAARKALNALQPASAATAQAHKITLADVHGQPEVKAAFSQLVTDLEAWKSGDLTWPKVTSSFLLKGPPGTGKTLLAQALAGSAGVTLVQTSYATCQMGGHQGDMLRELNTAVQNAIHAAPSILFIDEIDAFHARGGFGTHSGYIMGVVNGLLVEIDRVNATPGVILIAASNFPERVDPAIIRPGRFDQHLHVVPLDRTGVRAMIAAQIPGILTTEELERLSDQLSGQTGARVATLLRDAHTRARQAREPLCAHMVFKAANIVAPPPDRALLRRVAIHEAGHILMGHLCGLTPPKRAALRGWGGEIHRSKPYLLTPSIADAMIQVYLAGRVAESLFFAEVSSGAGGTGRDSDLGIATEMARRIELNYGFAGGLTWYDPATTLSLQPREIRDAIEARLRTADARVTSALSPHRKALKKIASVLIAEREIDQTRLSGLLQGIAIPKRDSPANQAPPGAG
jgi:ATP-dependent Zn protease